MLTFSVIMIALGLYSFASLYFRQLPAVWPRRLKKGEKIGTASTIANGVGFVAMGILVMPQHLDRRLISAILIVLIVGSCVAWWYDIQRERKKFRRQ